MAPAGATAPDAARASLGPVKVLLDDDALPTLDDLGETIRAAHAEHRAVAFPCVTRLQLVVAITALDAAGAGPGDRIEHGSVVPAEMLAHLRRLRLTVVTQPHFVAERGDDYLREVDPDDRGSLYRVRSLVAAGIPVAAGTDAPFGGFDPWASMAAAVDRRTRSGQDVGAGERIAARAAVDLYLGAAGAPAAPRTIAVGQPADLCVLGVPWRAVPSALRDAPVQRTYVAGTPVYEH
jgi:predicted amidohydrolase YtcJ